MTRQEFLVRYRWDEGDLGFSDNRSTMHYAVSDYGAAHRVIRARDHSGRSPLLTTPPRAADAHSPRRVGGSLFSED